MYMCIYRIKINLKSFKYQCKLTNPDKLKKIKSLTILKLLFKIPNLYKEKLIVLTLRHMIAFVWFIP